MDIVSGSSPSQASTVGGPVSFRALDCAEQAPITAGNVMGAHLEGDELYECLQWESIVQEAVGEEGEPVEHGAMLGSVLLQAAGTDLRDYQFLAREMATHVQPDLIQILGNRGFVAVRSHTAQQLIGSFNKLLVIGIELSMARFK